ncbi:RNA polymerase-binding protein RbpA [Gulosibacter macacae]|uniref:RNA polymerase-binding protein RbpA n=1 Tax=Gulosibacter macacae TaxID=2488791 RepID=A0A3P3W322_9MICO|nr:RNA polymerase-binding protein RbpA [Gulosibacter macacae]RRJ87233.1 RNA polymerase-binding protein RbpA [Gulosibacter macacae]
MAGTTGIRGARIGAAASSLHGDATPMADRIAVSYWDAQGNETVRWYAADIAEEDIPETIDSPRTGLPAGRDQLNPPSASTAVPYKTHFEYVQERRTADEGEQLLAEALERLRERRGTVKSN